VDEDETDSEDLFKNLPAYSATFHPYSKETEDGENA